MTEKQRRTNPFDPTDERTADPSTPGASGLGAGQDIADRARPDAPPRRPAAGEDDEPALPNDDPTLKTKI